MKILCKTSGSQNKLQAGQQVNKVGQYLYKHIDGAYKIDKSGNMCDVYFILLYEIPKLQRRTGHPEDSKLHEMKINLNITTYQNKIRVNILEVDPEERTLGCNTYSPELMENLEAARNKIFDTVIKKVCKAYEDYDFIF